MENLRILSAPEQVAEHLRRGISEGRFSELMPGEGLLSEELGLDAKIIARALRQLEEEGLLENQGPRRRRRIVVKGPVRIVRGGPLRIALFGGAAGHRKSHFLGDLPYRLTAAGHHAFYPRKPTTEFGDDLKRISKMVDETAADAWVVFAGSPAVLEWFSEQPRPVMSIWGRHHGLRIASAEPDRTPAYAELTRELVALGHRRVVTLTRHGLRMPTPGHNEQAFLDELVAHGIPVSAYHLPDWEETTTGFHKQLEHLFKFTPPTAVILDDTALLAATVQFLNQLGLRVPQDVSLACTEHDQGLDWWKPAVSHIRWDRSALIGRVLRWAKRISEGKSDIRAFSCPAEFVRGGTIGEVKTR